MAHDALRILLVEDEPTLADITAFRLELLGYDVITKHSSEAALAWIEDELPDVIILDLALAGGDGMELLNRLSNNQRTGTMSVMVFSTNADLDCVQRAFAAGAVEYLVTPYDPVNLETKIEKLSERKKK